MSIDDLQVWLELSRSEHPDDRRLPRPLQDILLECRIVPRRGEYLELPWPLSNDPDVPATAKVRAIVRSVEHFWIDADRIDGGERIPILGIRVSAELMEPDITDGPWE